MEFLAPLANAGDYPKPTVFALAKNQLVDPNSQQQSRRIPPAGSVILATLDHARSGLFVIAKAMTNEVVWLPSYHCPALVEPFIAAGKQVEFYPLTEQLTPDYSFLQQHCNGNEALVGVRFFGFDSGVKQLAQWCQQQGIFFIEDLAHAAFADKIYGDVAVTSLIKFFPVQTGGELLVKSQSRHIASLNIELNKLATNNSQKIKSLLNRIIQKLGVKSSTNYRYFLANNVTKNISRSNLIQINRADSQAIAQARINNYHYLVNKISDSPYGKVLFPSLAEGEVPYMVPFLLNNIQGFTHIRQLGIQIYRWEELAPVQCHNSQEYRALLVQLPCHQDLSHADLNVISTVLLN